GIGVEGLRIVEPRVLHDQGLGQRERGRLEAIAWLEVLEVERARHAEGASARSASPRTCRRRAGSVSSVETCRKAVSIPASRYRRTWARMSAMEPRRIRSPMTVSGTAATAALRSPRSH